MTTLKIAVPAGGLLVRVGFGLLGVAATLTVGCQTPAADADFTILNDDQHRPAVSITTTIDVEATADARAQKSLDGGQNWESLRPVSTVRVKAGGSEDAFGQASALAPLSDSAVMIVDKRIGQISRVSFDGRSRSMLPTPIPANYRLLTPTALAKVAPGTWMVGDWSFDLKLFKEEGEAWVPAGIIATGGIATDACVEGDRFIVRGAWGDGTTLHEYDVAGHLYRRYGPAFEHPSPIVRPTMSAGLVECSPALSTVVTMSNAFPLVHGYSRAGELLWTTEFSGMKLQRVAYRRTKSGTDSVRQERTTLNDTPVSLTFLHDDVVLFQFVRVEKPSPSQLIPSVHSVVLSASTGHGYILTKELPLVLAAEWPRIYATSLTDPTTVSVYEFQR